jgi:hypothetical protein
VSTFKATSRRSDAHSIREIERKLVMTATISRLYDSSAEYQLSALLARMLMSLCLTPVNVWNRAIFDALERRDATTVLYLSLVYVPLLAATRQLSPVPVHNHPGNVPPASRPTA